jgi:hypothetical protein
MLLRFMKGKITMNTNTNVISGAYAGMRTSSGAPSNGTSEVQLLTIGGTPNGGTIGLKTAAGKVSASTATWTATDATLVSRLQTVLDTLFGAGNTVAAIGTLSSGIGTVTITYAVDLGSLNVDLLVAVNNLTGSSPTAVITTQTAGVTATHRGAPAGTLLQDTTNGDQYINQGTAANPQWALVTTQ